MAVSKHQPGLARCLDSLAQQESSGVLETIVADGSGEAALAMAATYPAVWFLQFPEPLAKPQLLSQAIEQAHGAIVAVIEPYCCIPADWVKKLRLAHQSEFPVIGGAVEYDGLNTASGWACFLADYGAFMLPAERSATPLLAGNHISFKRMLLTNASDLWREGYVKTFLLTDLARRGCRFLFDPELVVTCAPESNWLAFARRYYLNGREFAMMRTRRLSQTARLAHIVAAPALPLLLLFRRLRSVWKKPRRRGRLILSIPLMSVFVLCWAAGEFVGYVSNDRSALQ